MPTDANGTRGHHGVRPRLKTQPTPYKVRTMSSMAGSSKVRSTTSVTALTSARTLAAWSPWG